MQVSDSEKAIAQHLATVFGTRPRIVIHRETADDPLSIAVARIEDYPSPGMVTLSTIGASNSPLYREDGSEYPGTRAEFVATCYQGQEELLAEALFLAALFVVKRKGFARPGIFLDNLIGHFKPTSTVLHGYLTSPLDDYEGLSATRDFAGRTVSWLQVVPVSANEVSYGREHSTDALEQGFEEHQVDVFNLSRPSAV